MDSGFVAYFNMAYVVALSVLKSLFYGRTRDIWNVFLRPY